MSLTFHLPAPAGAAENSPPLQRWVVDTIRIKSRRDGRKPCPDARLQPSLRDSMVSLRVPRTERPGLFSKAPTGPPGPKVSDIGHFCLPIVFSNMAGFRRQECLRHLHAGLRTPRSLSNRPPVGAIHELPLRGGHQPEEEGENQGKARVRPISLACQKAPRSPSPPVPAAFGPALFFQEVSYKATCKFEISNLSVGPKSGKT